MLYVGISNIPSEVWGKSHLKPIKANYLPDMLCRLISLSVVDFDVELIHPSMFLAQASAGKFPILYDVLIFIYNFGEFFYNHVKMELN